jgi:hypothetical protein
MSKTAISQYSSTPSSNSDVDGIDISEGCPASNLNNAQRSLMSHLKEMDDGTSALTSPSMGQLNVDNLRLDGNTISSTDTNGDITIDPDGTGDTIIASGNVGIGTSSPSETLHVEESTTGNAVRVARGGNYIVMGGSGSGTQYVKGYEGTVAFGNAFAGNTTFLTGDTERMRIDSSGRVTKPSQPAFQAIPSSNQNNIALNTEVTIIFGTERFDVGSNFASNTFTAPVTGKYYLDTQLRVEQIDTGANYYQLKIQTTNHTYVMTLDPNFTADMLYGTMSISIVADMDANDTTKVILFQSGGTQQADIDDESYFSGYLLG